MDYGYTEEKIEINEKDFPRIISFIHEHKGMDLTAYRQNFLFRRLRLRMLATKTKNYQEYTGLLEKKPDEFNRFLDALSINVTEFFRDPDVFDAVKKTVIPELIQRKEAGGNKVIRAWSAGCAYGQETYSLAILLKEALSERTDFIVRVWGTDVDADALEKADKAEYLARDLKELDKNIVEKYFSPLGDDSFRVKEEITNMVKFHRHNFINDPPMKFMDIIFCRNVMIYISHDQQHVLFHKFSEALHSKGYLVIGRVETIWEKDLFVPVEPKQKIYQKVK
jgi:chemotaxis protein methyltransferase CheR